jgi:hypothetical protein
MTVFGLMPSLRAISLLVLPVATSRRISCYPEVRSSGVVEASAASRCSRVRTRARASRTPSARVSRAPFLHLPGQHVRADALRDVLERSPV